MPDLSLQDRIALVTGASSGIGRATALELARRGARVAVNYPFPGEAEPARAVLDEMAASLEGASVERHGDDARLTDASGTVRAVTLRADVSLEDEVDALVAGTREQFGGLDVLVNNAGIQTKGAFHESPVESFDRVIAVNLRGPYLCSRAVITGWLEEPRTAERPGVIVNVSSVHEKIPRPRFVSYAVSKFGLHGLTQSVAMEYASQHIRVNAIGPGATVTRINAAWKDDPEEVATVESHIPMRRVAQPEEMARVIALLAGDAAPYMTGQTVFVDGGLTLYPDFQEPWSG